MTTKSNQAKFLHKVSMNVYDAMFCSVLSCALHATFLVELGFFLERTTSGVDLEMMLKGGVIACYPYHSHLPGF